MPKHQWLFITQFPPLVLKQGLKLSGFPLTFLYSLRWPWPSHCLASTSQWQICATTFLYAVLGIDPGSLCSLGWHTSLSLHHQLLTQNFWQGTCWLATECVCPLSQHLFKRTDDNKPSWVGDSHPGNYLSTFCLEHQLLGKDYLSLRWLRTRTRTKF